MITSADRHLFNDGFRLPNAYRWDIHTEDWIPLGRDLKDLFDALESAEARVAELERKLAER